MSMEDRTTQSDHNDKENPVSSSPDSGLCDLDTPPEDPPPESSKPRNSSEGRFRYGQTFDPFFFRYGPDNRKLTLLKSLSQDSEYSLDTSLFDAEEFLQDMGFAGTTDPTIPERFLPSLMQRLSRFPESEMEGLHHRIIQSIGCFRRKEGKRRLFRNLSMGKDSRTDPKHLLSCPSGNYPLLRSNTGPAEFPFNESTASAYETAGDSLKSGRLSSSDSGHHSMDSLKNEDEFPESPIAILVSAASVEQDEKSLEDEDSEGEDDASTLKQISDGEFVSTVQEIQKLTDEISDSDDAVSLMTKEGFEAAESSELGVEKKDGEDSKTAEDEFCIIENLPESVKGSCDDDKVQTVELGCEERSVLSDNNVKSPMKRPLRRISNAINYNPLRHSKRFGSMELQNSINENDDRMNCEAQEPNPVFRDPFSENNTNPFKNSECNAILDRASENRNTLESTPKSNSALNPFSSESVNSKVSISDSVDVFTNAPTLSHSFQFSSNATLSSSQADSSQFCTSVNTSDIEPRGRNSKPKFTRDDSLTNFLSSMLDMTESDSILKPPATPPPPHLKHEKQSKSDSEILQDNFSSEKFSMQYSVHKARSSESLNKVKSFSSYVQDKSAEVKSIAKSPTRKRRVLHRMSSSLQCCDDENCEDVDRFNVPEEFKFPPTNPFASVEIPPKPALRATQSNLSRTPGHRPVHPCSSLPAIKSCSSCETQNELGCAARWWNGQSSSDPEESRLHNRRRERRNCKKRRYLSCPSPEAKFNFNPWMNVRLFSGTCGAEMNRCQYLSESGLVPEIRGFPSRLVDHSEMRFSERHSGWDNCVCYKDCTCVNCHNFPDAHFQRSRIAVLPALPSRRNSRRCTWNSTPDVRCAHWNSFPKEYFAKPPVNSLSDPSVMRSGNLGAPSSFYEEAHFSHEIERTDCSCFLDPPDNAQTQRNKRLRVRTPQRQNSMSIDDPDEESLPNWNVVRHDNPCQDSIPNRNGYFLDSRHPDVPPPFNASRKSGAVAPTQNISDPNSRREKVSLRREVVRDKIHRLSSATSNIKNEAMMERKIRIFSKFFTNLGNLSKSIQDKNSDTKKQKEGAVSGSDKPLQWDTREAIPPENSCFTSPQEMEPFFETGSGNAPYSETCNDVTRCGSELNYPIYENRVLLQTNSKLEGHQKRFKPVQFTSSVSMYINSDENNVDFSFCRKECSESVVEVGRDSASTKSDEGSRPSSQMSFKVVSKELEDLQQSIQKAKEMRISASKELHLLQEILAGDDSSDGKSEEIRLPTVYPRKENTVRSAAMREHQALKDLREKSNKEVLEDTSFWQEELRKVKEETNQAWQAKLDRMEARLESQEDELRRLQLDNENLQKSLEAQRLGSSPTCHCKSDSGQNGFGRIDSAFEDDEEYFAHKPSIPIQSTRQECERLQERLTEEEQRADQLKLMLNQKLIEFNKLQITLSKQTKEMIELEKSYLQLQCRLRKGSSKPTVARLCSRTSPFSSKNLCPKPSPPATPQPNGLL